MSKLTELLDIKRIEYKDRGSDILIRCLNPEHEDSHPSMRVDAHTGVMHCLSCGFGKNIPSIFHYFNEDYYRQSPRLHQVKEAIKKIRDQTISLDIPESAILYEGEFKGVSNETIRKYYGFQQQENWEGRLVFPITDATGRNIMFLGRAINTSAPPKYLVKPKGVSPPIFPIRYNNPMLIIVEGIFDMLNLEDKGVDNASACFGTHQFSQDNVNEKFLPFIIAGVKYVVILLDNDKAGIKGAETLARLISNKTRLIPIVANELLPPDKDPGDLDQEEVDMLMNYIKILVDEKLNN